MGRTQQAGLSGAGQWAFHRPHVLNSSRHGGILRLGAWDWTGGHVRV